MGSKWLSHTTMAQIAVAWAIQLTFSHAASCSTAVSFADKLGPYIPCTGGGVFLLGRASISALNRFTLQLTMTQTPQAPQPWNTKANSQYYERINAKTNFRACILCFQTTLLLLINSITGKNTLFRPVICVPVHKRHLHALHPLFSRNETYS